MRDFLTSNMFSMVRHPLYSEPYIEVNDNLKLELEDGQTIKELRSKFGGDISFFTHDGGLMASSTPVSAFLTLPYFKVMLDGEKEYIVISEKSFSFNNIKYELQGDVKAYYDYCKGLKLSDRDALTLSKFVSDFSERLGEKKDWTREEFIQ